MHTILAIILRALAQLIVALACFIYFQVDMDPPEYKWLGNVIALILWVAGWVLYGWLVAHGG